MRGGRGIEEEDLFLGLGSANGIDESYLENDDSYAAERHQQAVAHQVCLIHSHPFLLTIFPPLSTTHLMIV